jgi:hypothetical protein
MPIDDRLRASPRQFRCRDRLWHTFEQMSEEQDKSVEELINDAMTAYAQLSGYETAVHAQTPAPAATQATTPTPTPIPARGARPQAFGGGPGAPRVPPAPPRLGRATAHAPAAPPPPPEGMTGPAPLFLVFDNQKYLIDKDQFIIGRGSKSSDLPIKDGNISRKHAAVIRRNGSFFIKDLGSTNGIDFKGMRIDNKRIDEGDVFHICEYELKFTYKR